MLDDAEAMAPLVAQLRNLAERQRALEAERTALEARRASWQAAQTDLSNLAAWCNEIAGRVDELTWEQRRFALTALDFAATVHPASHTPRYVITSDPDSLFLSNTT